MKVAIVLNGISQKKKFFYTSIYPSLQQNFKAEVLETQHAQHAIELASTAAKEKFDYIFAAGGDGTLRGSCKDWRLSYQIQWPCYSHL